MAKINASIFGNAVSEKVDTEFLNGVAIRKDQKGLEKGLVGIFYFFLTKMYVHIYAIANKS